MLFIIKILDKSCAKISAYTFFSTPEALVKRLNNGSVANSTENSPKSKFFST